MRLRLRRAMMASILTAAAKAEQAPQCRPEEKLKFLAACQLIGENVTLSPVGIVVELSIGLTYCFFVNVVIHGVVRGDVTVGVVRLCLYVAPQAGTFEQTLPSVCAVAEFVALCGSAEVWCGQSCLFAG